ncbi:Integration host factor alpha subunit [hydrothermal vent metagenome]|uniref:Integration host factor subunit alpha n=1 Tax=hydrothermal vent metagenome TaxID=652676 RepID=A0A3B0T1N4_9ZZZZ
MGGTTLTRADLCEAVYNEVGLSRTESAEIVESILEEVCSHLEKGDNVKLSSFGTFAVREKKGRIGRNPKTGEEVPITPRRVLVFRPSHVLRQQVNKRSIENGDE